MTGAGGDCFVLYLRRREEHGDRPQRLRLCAGGPVERGHGGTAASEQRRRRHGAGRGRRLVQACEGYGTRPLEELFRPAIAPRRGRLPCPGARRLGPCERSPAAGAQSCRGAHLPLPAGRAPLPGERLTHAQLARTLSAIARKGRSAFYEGEVAEDIVDTLRGLGGAHSLDDMAGYRANYVEPISTEFAGHRILECPPNGQGVIALLLLNILRHAIAAHAPESDADSSTLSPRRRSSPMRCGTPALADERHLPRPVADLLSEERSARLARLRSARRRCPPSRPIRHGQQHHVSLRRRPLRELHLLHQLALLRLRQLHPGAEIGRAPEQSAGMCFSLVPGAPEPHRRRASAPSHDHPGHDHGRRRPARRAVRGDGRRLPGDRPCGLHRQDCCCAV